MSISNISTTVITYSNQSNHPFFVDGGNITNSNSSVWIKPITNQTGSGEGNIWSGHCSDWKEAQHALFQLGNLCMIISFLTPSGFRYHTFFLRFMLNIGFVFSIIWAGFFICMMDILIWNFVFFILNSAHVIYLGYRMFPVRFSKTLEEVYAKMFKPLKVNRKQFRDLSQFANILLLAKGSVYAKEGNSKIGQKLSVLIKGRLKVTYEGLYLHSIMGNQFIDSPEYDAFLHHGNWNSTFQITITATEDSLLISWPHRRLQAFLDADPAFAHVFRKMISKDISQKLYLIQEMLMANPNYMQTLASRRSSMVNLRNSIVSNVNISKLSCFGVSDCISQNELPSNVSSLGTYETSV
ncbi:hypothetical protein CHS0354_007884 [Potamilus streckersoni]|uniref:POPDC1-3 domain-containing protein n=1 Tax=Potamilus streckersoni TaxID=2493646 RepID=A0AAE0SYP7_9BIVA|nr:hypothetical protein CHS0354_007884 [Potamilus streckersoni]